MNLIQSWNEFSAKWKKVRRDLSELTVHDLRVATRRLIAELEIVSAVTQDTKARGSIREFKKILKRLGDLRDIQVHLLRTGTGNSDLATSFSRLLKQREKEEIRRLRKWMKKKTKKNLRRRVWRTNQRLKDTLAAISRPVFRAAIEASVRKRCDAVLTAYASVRRSSSAEEFHRLRIKLKRFRYAAEVAKPVIGIVTERQIDRMRKLQKLMGEIHDLQTYMTAFAEWSGAKAPVKLQKEYDARMKAFNDQPGMFEGFNLRKGVALSRIGSLQRTTRR